MHAAQATETQRVSDAKRIDRLWQQEGLQRCRRGASAYALAVIVLTGFSALYSWIFEPELFHTLIGIRIALIASMAGLLGVLGTRAGEQYPRHIGLLIMLVGAVMVNLLAIETGGQTSPQQQRLVFVLYGAALLFTWNGWWALSGCSLVIAAFAITAAASGELRSEHIAGNAGRLFIAATFTVGVNILRERYRHRELWNRETAARERSRSEAEIRKLNEQLEQRVVERTADLHRSERRIRTMFDSAPIGIVIVDPTGHITATNSAFADILGRNAEEVIGASIGEVTAPEDRPQTQEAFERLLAGTETRFTMDKQYLRTDGTRVSAHLVVAIVRDDEGTFDYAFGMVEDVSDRVRAEAQVREHEDRLAHVLRIATLGEMAAELAHEINQPLGAIVNFANGTATRLRNADGDPELIESVSRISSEALRAAAILKRMHEFVQTRETEREATNVNELVENVGILLAGDARRNQVTLELQCAEDLPAIEVDRVQIEQMIFNLSRNAIDAVRESEDETNSLIIRTSLEHDCIVIRVIDDGPGIAECDRERVFDAFYSTKAGGLGMGLSISRTIAEAHGGQVRVDGSPERGVIMACELPLDHDHSAEPERAPVG